MIRNAHDVSGWRQEGGRRPNGMPARVETGRNRMTQHPGGPFA
jgi:hypothetical protein